MIQKQCHLLLMPYIQQLKYMKYIYVRIIKSQILNIMVVHIQFNWDVEYQLFIRFQYFFSGLKSNNVIKKNLNYTNTNYYIPLYLGSISIPLKTI